MTFSPRADADIAVIDDMPLPPAFRRSRICRRYDTSLAGRRIRHDAILTYA